MRKFTLKPEPEPDRLVTVNEVADHAHEPADHEPEPAAPAVTLAEVPAPPPSVLSVLANWTPSKETKVFAAHLGKHIDGMLAHVQTSLGESLYALRQIRNDAIGAVAKAKQTNDDAGAVAATCDVAVLTDVIERIS
jgi:hypothetical protein